MNLTTNLIIVIAIIAIAYIYLVWLFIKSAISRGVENGVYNAIVELKNNGVFEEINAEKYYLKNKFDKNTPPTN